MPWKETRVQDERMQFISDCLRGELCRAELCRLYGISRKTGYKLLTRYREEGVEGLKDRSRAPHHHPNTLSDTVQEAVLSLRSQHPTWGPRKILAFLRRQQPSTEWPCASTIGALFQRQGLCVPRRNRPRPAPSPRPLCAIDGPNSVWSIDFKGHFTTQDGALCYPLTLSDAYSRRLLRCQALRNTDTRAVQPLLQAAFQEYGLPRAIRSDNGPPFASCGVGRLSRLSIWWVRLGILPDPIAPGHPEQNGRHERLHRTLKADVPIEADLRRQQRAFDRFLAGYNQDRPHEALDYATPDQVYHRSERSFPLRLPQINYPDTAHVRRVRTNGTIKWRGDHLFVGDALVGESVALAPFSDEDDRYLLLSFGPLPLAILDDVAQQWLPRKQAQPILKTLWPGPTDDTETHPTL